MTTTEKYTDLCPLNLLHSIFKSSNLAEKNYYDALCYFLKTFCFMKGNFRQQSHDSGKQKKKENGKLKTTRHF